MNYKQLFISSTDEERLEALYQILQTIEARQNKLILASGRLIRNRRGAHFLHEKRRPRIRPLFLHAFLLVLCTVNVASWLIAVHAPPAIAAPVLASNLAMLTVILLVKPYKPRQVLSKAN